MRTSFFLSDCVTLVNDPDGGIERGGQTNQQIASLLFGFLLKSLEPSFEAIAFLQPTVLKATPIEASHLLFLYNPILATPRK